MTVKVEIPKKKPNYFNVYNRKENKYDEIKFLSQQEIAEGWCQVLPYFGNKNLINHFSVTLAFLPEMYWSKIQKYFKNGEELYKIISDGITKYAIIETNQDDIMIKLFNEIRKSNPDNQLLQNYINDLDESQHTSWLVLRAKYIINHNMPYLCHYVNKFDEFDITQLL